MRRLRAKPMIEYTNTARSSLICSEKFLLATWRRIMFRCLRRPMQYYIAERTMRRIRRRCHVHISPRITSRHLYPAENRIGAGPRIGSATLILERKVPAARRAAMVEVEVMKNPLTLPA